MLALALAACAADPMAGFARMVSGEWKVTSQSGTSLFHAWHWGPGRHSIRRTTDGTAADGKPWRELAVAYRHPGRDRVRWLGVSPFARGVSEGTIRFDGTSADGVFDLHQTGRLRKMGLRWAFAGPDKFRDTLLEATGPDGLKPLAEWDHVRTRPRPAPRPPVAKEVPKPSKHLKALEPLLGRSWEARGEWASKNTFHTRTSIE